MKRKLIIIAIIFLSLLNIFQFSWNQFTNKLFTDAVPTEEVALEVGKAVLAGAFGRGVLNEPFVILDGDNKWVIYSDFNGIGSVPAIVIRKSDGKILKLLML